MRTQHLLALSGLLLAGNVAVASKIDHDDVPSRCWAACGSVVGTAERCDHQHDDDDYAEMQCICNWDRAKTQVPLCAACIEKYDRDNDTDDDDDDDDDDNEALEIVRSCNFSTTTYNAAAATATGLTTTTAGSGASSTTTGASSTSSATGSGSGGSNTSGGTSNASTDASSSNDASQDAASATPTNAAAGMNAPGAISMAALAGLMPLAWL